MNKLTIGEKIAMAERHLDITKKEYEFCLKVLHHKIDVREHFAYLLVPTVFVNYRFDEDEEYYFEQEQEFRTISKIDYIRERKEEIRQNAKKNYLKQIAKYANVKQKCIDLKSQIEDESAIIKKAKRLHPISYMAATNPCSRLYSPSFMCSLEIGQSIYSGIMAGMGKPGHEYVSYIEQVRIEM